MDIAGANRYLELMKEIKHRTFVVHKLLVGETTTGFMRTNVETIYLQYRKILELIAFGSLVANLEEYAKARQNYSSDWHAARVLKAVESVHPEYYPKPVVQLRVEGKKHNRELHIFEGNYLTKSDFEELYDLCGGIMHSQNPYGSPIQYEDYFKAASEWGLKIRNLLNAHEVKLINEKQFYLIQMGSADAGPTFNLFERFDEDNPQALV